MLGIDFPVGVYGELQFSTPISREVESAEVQSCCIRLGWDPGSWNLPSPRILHEDRERTRPAVQLHQ